MKEGKKHYEPRMRQCVRRAQKLKFMIENDQKFKENLTVYERMMKKIEQSTTSKVTERQK